MRLFRADERPSSTAGFSPVWETLSTAEKLNSRHSGKPQLPALGIDGCMAVVSGVPTRASSPIRVNRALQKGNLRSKSASILKQMPKALPLPGSEHRKKMTRMGLARLGHESTTRQRHELSVHGQRRQALNAMNVAASSRSESEIEGTPSNMSLEGGSSVCWRGFGNFCEVFHSLLNLSFDLT